MNCSIRLTGLFGLIAVLVAVLTGVVYRVDPILPKVIAIQILSSPFYLSNLFSSEASPPSPQYQLAHIGMPLLRMLPKTDSIADKVAHVRNMIEASSSGVQSDINVTTVSIPAAGDSPAMQAEWITAPGSDTHRVLLFLHGGGYVWGSLNAYRRMLSEYARASSVPIFAPAYRLAPENPPPACLNDALSAYRYLIVDRKFKPSDIIVSGDSAGGGLALMLLQSLSAKKQPEWSQGQRVMPRAAVLLSPYTDLTFSWPSMGANKNLDWMLSVELVHFCREVFVTSVRDEHLSSDFANPLFSPSFGPLSNALPPLYIWVGENEILKGGIDLLADKLRASGHEHVRYHVGKRGVHVIQLFAPFIPEAREALNEVAGYVREAFAEQPLV